MPVEVEGLKELQEEEVSPKQLYLNLSLVSVGGRGGFRGSRGRGRGGGGRSRGGFRGTNSIICVHALMIPPQVVPEGLEVEDNLLHHNDNLHINSLIIYCDLVILNKKLHTRQVIQHTKTMVHIIIHITYIANRNYIVNVQQKVLFIL